jgi:hypothetical protein
MLRIYCRFEQRILQPSKTVFRSDSRKHYKYDTSATHKPIQAVYLRPVNVNIIFARELLRTRNQLAKLPDTRRSPSARKHRLTLHYMAPMSEEKRKSVISK